MENGRILFQKVIHIKDLKYIIQKYSFHSFGSFSKKQNKKKHDNFYIEKTNLGHPNPDLDPDLKCHLPDHPE